MNEQRVATALRWWLARVTRFPLASVAAAAVLAALSLQITAEHLGFDTDTTGLLDPDVPFRKAFSRYTDQFPQHQNTLVAVVEAPAPELARSTADRLADALRRQGDTFPLVYQPGGDDFLRRNALLYMDTGRLAMLGDRLAQAQPLLARLARDPSIAGYFNVLNDIAGRARNLNGLTTVVQATTRALESGDGISPLISWDRLIRGDDPHGEKPSLSMVVTVPRLQYDRIMAGRVAMEQFNRIREGLPRDHPHIRIRVTGKVALQHEELHSALRGAKNAGLAALFLVALVLYAALRSWPLLAAALVTLGVGMALSAGAATLAVGHLNLISIAFAVLYVGLGINYAVHYLIRYREALGSGHARREAVCAAGERLGVPLILCTVTTAIGFLAFVPTAFTGIAELGIIAGLSMFITLAVTYTLLPALLMLLPAPPASGFNAGLPLPAHRLDWPARHPQAVRVTALLLAILGLLLATQVRFDNDPLNLRDPESESVSTAMYLMDNGGGAREHLVVLAENRQQLRTVADKLEALDAVRTTMDLSDLVPDDQEEKLRQIRDLELVLGPAVTAQPFELRRDPDPAATVEAGARLLAALRARAGADPDVRRLAAALDAWLHRVRSTEESLAAVRSLQDQVLGTLPLALASLQTALSGAGTFTETDLPGPLRERYYSSGGQFLLQIFPAHDLSEPGERRRFVESVQAAAPAATGGPVLQHESGHAVVAAFRTALTGAVAGISLVLLLLLRSVGMTVRVLVPLVLGGVLTVTAMVLLGLPFNFANVIALPLLLGVGVDNGIHMVSRQREGGGAMAGALHTSTARAILFGSLATIVSFGNLALSPHRGTATMGVVLSLGMILILATTFYVLPALFRRAPESSDDRVPADA